MQAVIAIETDFLRHVLVIGHQKSAVADGVEVFQRVCRERADIAERAAMLSLVVGAHRLCCVLDHEQLVFARDVEDRIHVGDAAAPMYRHDRLCARRDFLFDLGRIDVLVLTDVSIDGRRTDMGDGARRRDKGNRRGDDFIAFADAERPKSQHQGIGPVCAAHAMFGAGEFRDAALEIEHLLGHHQVSLRENALDAGHQLGLLFDKALLQIDERNLELGH